MKKFVFLFLCLPFFFLFAFSFVSLAPLEAELLTGSFSRNLGLGSSGADVFQLQLILNSDTGTKVAVSGPGSSGMETNYFGALTKKAVMKFQAKYASEILSAGLAPTGFVGHYTRRKLNSLLRNMPAFSTPTPPISSSPPPAPKSLKEATSTPLAPISPDLSATDRAFEVFRAELDAAAALAIRTRTVMKVDTAKLFSKVGPVILYYPSLHAGAPGATVILYGAGLTPTGNTAYFGENYSVRNLSSLGGSTLSFVVPNIPPGKYRLAFGNKNGVSNTTYFVVTSPGAPVVKVLAVSPESVSYGETVTITGSGFLTEGNTVITNFGRIENLASADGKSLSFSVSPENLRSAVSSGRRYNKEMKVPVFVLNRNGMSSELVLFSLQF